MKNEPEKDVSKQKVSELFVLAEKFYTLQSYEDAYYLYQKLKNYPDYISRHELARKISNCLYRMARIREILNPFANLILNDEDIAFLNKLADQLDDQGFLNEAVDILCFINQNNALFQEYVREQRTQMDITLALQQGEYFLRKKRYQQAMRQFQLAINLGYNNYDYILKEISKYKDADCKDAQYWMAKGGIYLKLDRYLESGQCYEYSLNLLGKTARNNVLKQLEDIYYKALKKNPDDSDLNYRVAWFYFNYMKDYDKSKEYFHFLLQDGKFKEKAACYLGMIAYQQKEWEKALDYMEKAALGREHFDILYTIGEHFEQEKNLFNAYRAYKLINNIEPDYKKISLKIHSLKQKFNTDQLSKYNIPVTTGKKQMSPLQGLAARRYEYISHLGSGGMGNVYKVHDLIQDSIVAIKLLVPELRRDTRAIELFFKEAQLASSLNHPYIVNIYDFGFEPRFQQSYISMEYVEGSSLRKVIQDGWDKSDELTQVKIDKYLPFIIQLLEALTVSHENGIIHRDIKPDNILVTKSQTIKVTDFGIACLDFAGEQKRDKGAGTPKYMSPEQISGKLVDHRTDIYSAGILMYEMFSGEPPFTIGDISYQHQHVSPLSLREIYRTMPPELDTIIMKCLEKDPDDRFHSVIELLSSLKGYY